MSTPPSIKTDFPPVVLSAIEYRISRPEPWCVVFTETNPIGNRPTRFMIHRRNHSIWMVQPVEGWDDVPCSHINQAYCWCLKNIGDDFAQEPLQTAPNDQPANPTQEEFEANILGTMNRDTLAYIVGVYKSQRDEIADLRKIANKFPRTADGSRIFMGENLFAIIKMNETPPAYSVVPCGFITFNIENGGTARDEDGNEYDVDYNQCYSTEAAALAAQEPE